MSTGIRCGIGCGIGAGIVPAPDGTVAATLTTRDMVPDVATSDVTWRATLTWNALGTGGNAGSMEVFFADGNPHSAEVRDGQRYNGAGWESAPNTIGILIISEAGVDEITVAEIESEIDSASSLAQVTTPDPAPNKTVDMVTMESLTAIGTFSGGA